MTYSNVSEATFTQQQNTVVSPVFESLIRLHSHTICLFTEVTNAFHGYVHFQLLGLTTAFTYFVSLKIRGAIRVGKVRTIPRAPEPLNVISTEGGLSQHAVQGAQKL